MRCTGARDQLLRAAEPLPVALASHLAACAACAGFAELSRRSRRALRDHHLAVEPDASFATRGAASVAARPSEILGWAALRLLPVALALIALLALIEPSGDLLSSLDGEAYDLPADEALWLAQTPGDTP